MWIRLTTARSFECVRIVQIDGKALGADLEVSLARLDDTHLRLFSERRCQSSVSDCSIRIE